MNADERIESLVQEHSVTLGNPNNAALSLVGEDNPYFRAIRKAGAKAGVTVVDGFRATMPVLVDSSCEQTYVLTSNNDVDNLMTDGLSCVAEATLIMLRTYGLTGKHVCIVGRGHAVKGLAQALLAEDATVTVCHSKTKYLMCLMQDADMVVVAAPIKEHFRPRYTSVIVDVSGAFAEEEDKLKAVCEYTRHIGKLTVAVLLERVARWRDR